MRKAHKVYSIIQVISLILIIIYSLTMAINPLYLLGLFAVVFFLEIGILEQQNKYKKEEIFYQKSGFFANFAFMYLPKYSKYFFKFC